MYACICIYLKVIDIVVYMYLQMVFVVLEKEQNGFIGIFSLAVPVFHSYGHKVDCQVLIL